MFFLHEEPLHSATPRQRVCRARRLFGKKYEMLASDAAPEKLWLNRELMAATIGVPTASHYYATMQH